MLRTGSVKFPGLFYAGWMRYFYTAQEAHSGISEISAAPAADRRVVDCPEQCKRSEPRQRRDKTNAGVTEIIAERFGKTAA